MKILLTGSSGFIGSYVAKALQEHKDIEVITTSKTPQKQNHTKHVVYDLHKKSDKNLYDFFEKPDILIHLAWGGLPNYNELLHIENVAYHYEFIKNLIKNGLKKVVITGTCFEYGMANGCLKEDMPTNPENAYAIAKDTLRKNIQELNKHYNFTYNWIRLFYMYGKGQSKKSLLSLLDKAIKNKEESFNMSGGEQIRDYLHVKEVAKYIVQISIKQNRNDIINCCSGEPTSVRKLVENYLKDKKINIKLNLGHYPYSEHEPFAFWGDNEKLKKYHDDNKG